MEKKLGYIVLAEQEVKKSRFMDVLFNTCLEDDVRMVTNKKDLKTVYHCAKDYYEGTGMYEVILRKVKN